MNLDEIARKTAEETPELDVGTGAFLFGGYRKKTVDPRDTDPNWMPDEHEVAIPMNYRLIVMPRRMRMESASGIDLSAARGGEELLCDIGRIIAVGALVQEAATLRNDRVKLERGQWITYGRHKGQKRRWRGIELVCLLDDHVDWIIADPSDWQVYL